MFLPLIVLTWLKSSSLLARTTVGIIANQLQKQNVILLIINHNYQYSCLTRVVRGPRDKETLIAEP